MYQSFRYAVNQKLELKVTLKTGRNYQYNTAYHVRIHMEAGMEFRRHKKH
jgi:hypothetical protein